MKEQIKDLKVFLDDRGSLFEALRVDDKIFDTEFAQLTVATVFPGVVKAWHRHQKQTDFMVCVKGNIKLCLTENGKDIRTYFLGEKNPILIKIPKKLWHGYICIGDQSAIVLYVTNQTYNKEDEERLDWQAFGDVWAIKNK